MLMIDGSPTDSGSRDALDLLRNSHRRIEWYLLIMADVLARTGGDTLAAPDREVVRAALAYLEVGAAMHADDEQRSLFSRLRAMDETGGVLPDLIERLDAESEAIREAQATVSPLCHAWLFRCALTPAEAASLRESLAALDAAYRAHIEGQEQDLFPLAAYVIDASDMDQIAREMMARRNLRCAEASAADTGSHAVAELDEWEVLEYRLVSAQA
jgi:hemerythrin HHE cation binding domain-containing protein